MYLCIVHASMAKHLRQPPSLESLKEQIHKRESIRSGREQLASGCFALDRVLGARRGTLMEYIADAGSGAATLAFIAAREACREGGALVVVDRQFPQAANSLGIDLTKVIVVKPRSQKDQLWVLHQSLSCKGVAAVLCWQEKLGDRAYRSLQLAAEAGGATGFFVRPTRVRGYPTWCEVQVEVETLPAITMNRRLRVGVVRSRYGKIGAMVELELNDETGILQESRVMSLASELAVATSAISTARA